jgi:hypothetical protein
VRCTRAGSRAACMRAWCVAAEAPPAMHPAAPSPLNSTRTNWTRLVPHPVLTGHVSSLAAGSHAVPYHRPLSHLCRYIYCAAPQDKGERRDDKAAGLARHRAVGALLADLHILETVALYKTPRPESTHARTHTHTHTHTHTPALQPPPPKDALQNPKSRNGSAALRVPRCAPRWCGARPTLLGDCHRAHAYL